MNLLLNKLRFKKKHIVSILVFLLLLLVLASTISHLKTPVIEILKYPLNLLTLLRHELGGIIFYHRNLMQNERSKKEIDLLKNKLNTSEEIYLENKRLEQLLSLKQKSQFKVVASRVIGRAIDSWSSIIIIDKGGYNGIKRGMVAITYLGLVGRVIETTISTSKVMLINDPDFSVSSIVQRSRQEGLVSGTLGSSLIMEYLPKDSDIKVSDLIITSGLTATYPKGLLIGTVVDIGEEFSGLSRYAVIKPAVNLSNIEEVLIIIP